MLDEKVRGNRNAWRQIPARLVQVVHMHVQIWKASTVRNETFGTSTKDGRLVRLIRITTEPSRCRISLAHIDLH